VAAPADDLAVSNDSAPVLLTRDVAGVITYVDERITAMLGWTPEQLVGLPSTKFIHPDDQLSAVAAWLDMITSPETKQAFEIDKEPAALRAAPCPVAGYLIDVHQDLPLRLAYARYRNFYLPGRGGMFAGFRTCALEAR
jgi:hypothetical protein